MRRRPVLLAPSIVVVLSVVAGACGGSDDAADGDTGTATVTATAPTAGTPATGDARETVETFTTAAGVAIEYVLLVPPGREEGEPGNVLVAFPPGGQDLELTQQIVDDRYRDEALARGWVVASPAAPETGLFLSDASAALVPEWLDEVARRYPPEGGRFDLMGVSNGGLSAFRAALAEPDRFRSLVTYPGNSPLGGDDPSLADLAGLGVALFVGADDSAWLGASRATQATLAALGITVELHEVPGEGHIIESLTGAELFDALERVRT